MVKGVLVNNQFYTGSKMQEINDYLIHAAKCCGMELEVRKSGELMHSYDRLKEIRADFFLYWDKDIVLARMLESLGFPVFNSANAIADCDNKACTYIRLKENDIKTPKTVIAPLTYEGINYCDDSFLKEPLEYLSFPIVVKELYGSFGKQVYLAHDREELDAIIGRLGCKGFLMQELIMSSYGKDLRVNVVGDHVSSCMLRYNEHGDFRSNISNGGNKKPYAITEEQKDLAIRACMALKLDFAGVDILFGEDDEPMICEVNSNPHFKSSVDCTGIDISLDIMEHIRSRIIC